MYFVQDAEGRVVDKKKGNPQDLVGRVLYSTLSGSYFPITPMIIAAMKGQITR